MPVAPLRFRVWQRHGQLRLYISGDGLDAGWYDPRTGRFELRQPALEPEFWQAVHAGCDQLLRDGRLSEAAVHRPGLPRLTARPFAELVAGAHPPGAEPEPKSPPPARPADVAVLRSPRALRRWLRRQPQVLDDGQVAALYEVARRPGTWQPRPAGRPGLTG
jgi:hypothetical protein